MTSILDSEMFGPASGVDAVQRLTAAGIAGHFGHGGGGSSHLFLVSRAFQLHHASPDVISGEIAYRTDIVTCWYRSRQPFYWNPVIDALFKVTRWHSESSTVYSTFGRVHRNVSMIYTLAWNNVALKNTPPHRGVTNH